MGIYLKRKSNVRHTLLCLVVLLGGVRIVEEFFRGELNEDDLADESFSSDDELLLPFLSELLRSASAC